MPYNTLPSIEELGQMDDLSAATLYRLEVRQTPMLSETEREHYLTAARTGDTEARNVLVTDCLHYVLYKAGVTYRHEQPCHTEALDLAGQAHVTMLERFEHALRADKPVKYLLSIAALEMKLTCLYDDPLVKRSRNRPFRRDHPRTVAIKETMEPALSEPLAEPDYPYLQPTMQALSERHRQVLNLAFGLFGGSQQGIDDIARMLHMSPGSVRTYLWRAKRRLRQKLGEMGIGCG